MPIALNPSILKLTFCFFLFWVLGVNYAKAEKPEPLKIRKDLIFAGNAQYGKVLATNPFLKQVNAFDDKIIEYAALSFQVLKQTTGDKLWERNYGLPTYGLGAYSANFFDNKGFGTPVAVYGVFKAPFKRWNSISLNYEAALGFTFNWKAFNPSENNYNTSLGATESVFIDLGPPSASSVVIQGPIGAVRSSAFCVNRSSEPSCLPASRALISLPTV